MLGPRRPLLPQEADRLLPLVVDGSGSRQHGSCLGKKCLSPSTGAYACSSALPLVLRPVPTLMRQRRCLFQEFLPPTSDAHSCCAGRGVWALASRPVPTLMRLRGRTLP